VSIGSKASSLASAATTGQVAQALAAKRAASSDRPGLRSDLIIRELIQMGEASYVVKNPEDHKVYLFPEGDWGLIQLFNGTRTLSEIKETYDALHPGAPLPRESLAEYFDSLRGMDLLDVSGVERNLAVMQQLKDARKIKAKEREEGFNPMMILFPVGDPNAFLDKTIKYVRWLWTPPAVAGAFVLFFLTASVFIGHYSTIWRETIELYSFLKKPFWDFVQFFLIMTIIGAVHELGHAYAMKSLGGEVHGIGFALVNFLPAYYCDTNDSFLLPSKWERLWVTVGGIYTESFVCVAATGVWAVTYPDTVAHAIAYKTMLFTGVSTLFFNLNPLMPSDGMHIIASLVDLPEMRDESIRYLGAVFQRYILRLPVDVPVYSRRRRRIYLLYAPLTILYTTTIMLLVAKILQSFYTKYFGELAILLVILTMARILRKKIRIVTRAARMVYLDKKEWLMSERTRKYWYAAGAALLLFVAVPWSRQKIDGDAVLTPARRIRVEAPDDSTVTEVFVREGDTVRRGQPLLSLTSPSLDDEILGLSAHRSKLVNEAGESRASGAAPATYRAEEKEIALDAALQRDRNRQEALVPKAPLAGRVLTADVEDLVGRHVAAGSTLVEVGDCSTMLAELRVSERLFSDLTPGSAVLFDVPGRPLRPIRGVLASVSPIASKPVDSGASSDRHGLAQTDMPDQFVAIARFENSDGTLLSGLDGHIRISGPYRSILGRSARILYFWVRRIFW